MWRRALGLIALALLGAVLAGGESRRFGSDKAAAMLGGRLLVERAAETLSSVFPEVVVISARPPVTPAWLHVPEPRPGEGPLAAIEAALLWARKRGLDGVFVLACDLPLVTESTVRAVAIALGSARAVAPARDGVPGVDPLCAAYSLECTPFVSAALDRGERAVHVMFESVGGAAVVLPREELLNVNTPRDHERAAAVLRGGAG